MLQWFPTWLLWARVSVNPLLRQWTLTCAVAATVATTAAAVARACAFTWPAAGGDTCASALFLSLNWSISISLFCWPLQQLAKKLCQHDNWMEHQLSHLQPTIKETHCHSHLLYLYKTKISLSHKITYKII